MHVHAEAAAIDLADPQVDEVQQGIGDALALRGLVQREQRLHGIVVDDGGVGHTGLHGNFLWLVVIPMTRRHRPP